MTKTEIKNAVIRSADFSVERMCTHWLDLDYGGSGQGFGGYALCSRLDDQGNFGGHYIEQLLETVDVLKHSQLVGKAIRVKLENGFVTGIGHIIYDRWFFPKQLAQDIKEALNAPSDDQ